jgi:hypothetical protein
LPQAIEKNKAFQPAERWVSHTAAYLSRVILATSAEKIIDSD